MKRQVAVVTRRVGAFQTFGMQKTSFSPRQIEELRQQPFATDVAPFVPARFEVYASVHVGNGLVATVFTSCGDDDIIEEIEKPSSELKERAKASL